MLYKKTYILYFVFFLWIPFVFSQDLILKKESFKNKYIAGEDITLEFTNINEGNYKLYCSFSYGTTLLKPIISNKNLIFKIPINISNKKGIIKWKLINKNVLKTGKIKIVSNSNSSVLETYLGPPSIEAGGKDYTMWVCIPTDNLDNPLEKNSKVVLKTQHLNTLTTDTLKTNNLIAYKEIYSPLKTGSILLSSNIDSLHSKEYDITVLPAIPTNFTINFSRNHTYADGNQITTFFTSIIKDKNNNIVSDGTYVNFIIKNKENVILKTSGLTIKGIATSEILHPNHEDSWSVKAYVAGVAESNVVNVFYKQAVKDFNVIFSKKNREIKVGPVTSFMNQIIPDGLPVKFFIYKNSVLQETVTKTTKDGIVKLYLNKNLFTSDLYAFKIQLAGITKNFTSIKVW